MGNEKLYLSEIFSAIQGEGPFVGVRQVFVRFSGCDLRCAWCDTPDSLIRSTKCLVETKAGSRKFKTVNNPISAQSLIGYISKLSPDIHHSISLTGGEPLLQSHVMSEIIPVLKKEFKIPIYLETGGHRPDKLSKVLNSIDYVSMDIKLPTSAGTDPFWSNHKEFLRTSLKSKKLKKIWVKIVISNKTSFSEILKATKLVKNFSLDIDIFIQPVSKMNGIKPPNETSLLDIQAKVLEIYPNVRVLPQMHRLMGQK